MIRIFFISSLIVFNGGYERWGIVRIFILDIFDVIMGIEGEVGLLLYRCNEQA